MHRFVTDHVLKMTPLFIDRINEQCVRFVTHGAAFQSIAVSWAENRLLQEYCHRRDKTEESLFKIFVYGRSQRETF